MMQVLSPTELPKIMDTLKEGGVIAYPTETSYGLGCDVGAVEATQRIFQIKQRPQDRSLIMLVKDVSMAQEYVYIPEKAMPLVSACWPGPVTFVFFSKKDPHITCAVRVSSHSFVQQLFRVYPHPIFSTSLNIHGQSPCYSYQEFTQQFEGTIVLPEVFVDAGALPKVPASLMIDMTKEIPVIIREGSLFITKKVKQLMQDLYALV